MAPVSCGLFSGVLLGLVLIASTPMFFWSWPFALDFHFCRQPCYVLQHSTKPQSCPSNKQCMAILAGSLVPVVGLPDWAPLCTWGCTGAPWWAISEDRTVAPGHVLTWLRPSPHTALLIPVLVLLYLPPPQTCQDLFIWLVKWGAPTYFMLLFNYFPFTLKLLINSFH